VKPKTIPKKRAKIVSLVIQKIINKRGKNQKLTFLKASIKYYFIT
jgi:hypothetical protein